MGVEDKWRANQEKVTFTKQFPGLLHDWTDCVGKSVERVLPLTGRQGAAILLFTDGCFVVVPPIQPEPWELGQALRDARRWLESHHPGAYAEWDRLSQKDQQALRAARVEKILGAIRNNLDEDLKARLKELIKEWK